jgi:hypothetical protein
MKTSPSRPGSSRSADRQVPASVNKRCLEIFESVGPLRFQVAEADCVPATVINALLVATKRTVPLRLLRLIWATSLDQRRGTGWVCSKLLVDVLEAWFTRSGWDKERETLDDFTSIIKEGASVSLGPNNPITSTLNQGGVVCLTVHGGEHYALLHSVDGDSFYGFDPTWPKGARQRSESLRLLESSHGVANVCWQREELADLLKDESNQSVHIIRRRVAIAVG